MANPAAARTARHARMAALGAAAALVAVILAIALLEGDLGEEFGDVGGVFRDLTRRFGAPGSVLLLYVEESGIPLPVPGDVYVAYLGSLARGSALELVAAWIAIVLAVTAGATNLYLVANRWGHRLIANRYAHVFHLDEGRLARVEAWIRRWGAIAVIFGRHIPGFRIPITVMSGIFELPYHVFAASVAVSTGVWAAVWLFLGARYGPTVTHALGRHTWVYAVIAGVIAVAVAVIGIRIWRAAGAPPTVEAMEPRAVEDSREQEPNEDGHEEDEHEYDAREEHVATGPSPQDVGGTEDLPPRSDRDHPGDAPGG